jgi:hypothetical protein
MRRCAVLPSAALQARACLTARTPWLNAGTSPAAYLFDTRGPQSATILPSGRRITPEELHAAVLCRHRRICNALRVGVTSAKNLK